MAGKEEGGCWIHPAVEPVYGNARYAWQCSAVLGLVAENLVSGKLMRPQLSQGTAMTGPAALLSQPPRTDIGREMPATSDVPTANW